MQAHESKPAVLLLLLSGVLAFASRQALQLAARSRVGAVSESHVRQTSSSWSAEAGPSGTRWTGRAVGISTTCCAPRRGGLRDRTKTLRYTRGHLVRTVDSARWLARRRWRSPAGVCPVLCVTRARRSEHIEDEVLVVSLDRLMHALRGHAPPPAMVDRRDDRASGRRLTTERGLDDGIEESADQ